MSTVNRISIAPAPFSEAERAALDVLMDLLIPASADGRMPAARTLRLYDNIATMRSRERTILGDGLAELDRRALAELGVAFAKLDEARAKALVDAMREEGSAFVQTFVAQTVGRYVSHPSVMPLLGLEVRPLWPQGNVVAEGDWSLLDVVREREKFYRKV